MFDKPLYLILLIFLSFQSFRKYGLNGEEINLDLVVSAFEKTVNYIHRNKNKMNVDAMFLTVLTQANINYLKLNNVIKKKYFNKIINVENKILDTHSRLKEIERESSRNYLFKNTILNPQIWNKPIQFRNNTLKANKFNRIKINNLNKLFDYYKKQRLNEQNSDACLMELLQQSHRCKQTSIMSPFCIKTMGLLNNQSFDRGYGITHSLLYLQIAKSQRCNINETGLKEKIKNFCSVILWEMKKIAEFGFHDVFDDLVLEQVTLCGYEGFSEFFSSKIIDHILNIQDDLGCFGIEKDFVGRIKRESNFFNDGCTDHATGLGLSALSLILRFILR
ncbi:UPF0764 protein C16orf89 homolog isoform X1 [Onthophagus taurus]|uniref:UPF0764 protein C16orf89 homolog isoform X1 n=2 Tax=Onthophagus taurus TaxID=166361 RepID=UPI0039BE76DA